MLEGGIHDLQVESLNEFVESYAMWNAAQPASKVRAPTLVHQDYISVFRKWGATVFNEYEIKRLDYARQNSCAHPSTDLDIELDCFWTNAAPPRRQRAYNRVGGLMGSTKFLLLRIF